MTIYDKITDIATQMDNALDKRDSQIINNLINDLLILEQNETDKKALFKIYYNLGTAYADLIFINKNNFIGNEEHVRKSILYYRKGELLIEEKFLSVNDGIIQLLTNLGNTYSCMNRFTEAIEVFKKALLFAPNFSMANGNLGECLLRYSLHICNPYKSYLFQQESLKHLKMALDYPQYIDSEFAKEDFMHAYFPMKEHYEKLKLNVPKIKTTKYKTKSEANYRKWSAENNLFLNELNDIDNSFLTEEDSLHIPEIIENIDIGFNSKFHSSFNELKQDYISNRYFLYEVCQGCTKHHFSDNFSGILETFDYSIYTLNTTKLKSIFKNIYSLFDKIAFFINEYFNLNIPYKEVSFKSIWKNEKNRKTLFDIIKYNNSLYSLYWIYIDLFSNFELSTDPKINKINKIRNSIEHRSFKIVDVSYDIDILGENKDDSYEFKISYSELKAITLYLFKILRTAMLNLVYAVMIEENKKIDISDIYIPPIRLPQKDKRDNIIIFN